MAAQNCAQDLDKLLRSRGVTEGNYNNEEERVAVLYLKKVYDYLMSKLPKSTENYMVVKERPWNKS